MRAFNSFCGLRRFAALNPHLARNTIAWSEQATQSVIVDAVKGPLYSQIFTKSLDFQSVSLQGNQKRSYQLHLIKATVNMCEVSIKHVLSPRASIRAFWLARSRAPLWRSLPRDWWFERRLLRAAPFEVVFAALPHLKTLRTQMRTAFEHCEAFLAQETFQDQYTHVKIFDRVAFICRVFFSDRLQRTFWAVHRSVASDICIWIFALRAHRGLLLISARHSLSRSDEQL